MNNSPNILFIMADQFRHDFMGCAGAGFVRTPNIDRIAARGVRFTQCTTNAPVCAPARIALAMGMQANRFGGDNNNVHLPLTARTYYQRLRDAGYRVGCVGKLDLAKPYAYNGREGRRPLTYSWGFTDPVEIEGKMHAGNKPTPVGPYGFMLQEKGLYDSFHQDYLLRARNDWALTCHDSILPEEDFADTYVGRRSVQWLDEVTDEYPWHLFVSFPGPHDPFDPPARYSDMYRSADMPHAIPANPDAPQWWRSRIEEGLSPEKILETRRQYCASITAIDDATGRILATVEKRGMLDNTIVLFSSDHGEMLGDHGIYTKSVPFESAVRVPLIVAGPGLPREATSDVLVELIDLNPTICELAGLPRQEGIDGQSIVPVLNGRRAGHRAASISSLGSFRLVRTARHKFVLNTNSPPELYDLSADPNEQNDLAGTGLSVQKELLAMLKSRFSDPPGIWADATANKSPTGAR